MKKNYRVWFEQINQTHIDVVAETRQQAIDKAYRKWRNEEGQPLCTYVEKEGEPCSLTQPGE